MKKLAFLCFLALLLSFAMDSSAKSSKGERIILAEQIISKINSGTWYIQLDRFNPNFDMYYDQLSPERNFVAVRDGILYRYINLEGARKVNNGNKYERAEESHREQPDYQMRAPIYIGGKQFENTITEVKTALSKNYRQLKIQIYTQNPHPFVITVSLPSGRATTMPIFFGDEKSTWQGQFKF